MLIQICSCGKQDFPNYEKKEVLNEDMPTQYFRAKFKPLNASKNIKAEASLWIKENQFYARVVLTNGLKETRFQQYIHSEPKCPGKHSDLNRDGKIDSAEVIIASGELLVPLDGNLGSQLSGGEWYPSTGSNGIYYYAKAAAYSEFIKDLRKKDHSPEDNLSKLGPFEDLELDQRSIVIYGSENDPLKPIACAEIDLKKLH